MRFTICHYSLVTTPPGKLAAIQRIPHIDSLGRDGLASIHCLFKKNLGGTAFYRHRKTRIAELRVPTLVRRVIFLDEESPILRLEPEAAGYADHRRRSARALLAG